MLSVMQILSHRVVKSAVEKFYVKMKVGERNIVLVFRKGEATACGGYGQAMHEPCN